MATSHATVTREARPGRNRRRSLTRRRVARPVLEDVLSAQPMRARAVRRN